MRHWAGAGAALGFLCPQEVGYKPFPAPSTLQPHRRMGTEEGSRGPHLAGSPSFHEEVLLQCGVGFYWPPGLIPHTQPSAQGQADESGCRGHRACQSR